MGKKHASTPAEPIPAAADAAVFRAAVRDVKPLKVAPRVTPAPARKLPTVRRKRTPPMHDLDELMPLLPVSDGDGKPSFDDGVAANAALSYQRAGVRPQVMRRLKRGLFPSENELDLHGLTQTAARDRVADFIFQSREAGCRCVRIVHGKGYRSGTRGPVIKTAVDQWLRRHLDIIAFTSARPIDGGTGAVYVLLRA